MKDEQFSNSATNIDLPLQKRKRVQPAGAEYLAEDLLKAKAAGEKVHVAYREVVPVRREETSHDLYLTEKGYRAYGLRGDRRNVTSHSITSAVESRRREYEGEHLLRQTNFIYRDDVPAHRENVHSDCPYLNGVLASPPSM